MSNSKSDAAAAAAALQAKKDKKKVKAVTPMTDMVLAVMLLVAVIPMPVALYQRKATDKYLYIPVIMIVFHFLVLLCKIVSGMIGMWISNTFLDCAPFHNPMRKKSVYKKFVDQSWQLMIHVGMTLAEVYVLSEQSRDWIYDPKAHWDPLIDVQTNTPSVELLYLLQFSVWTYTAVSCRFFEERRHDYVVMMMHHICTVLLVGGSYYGQWYRVGVAILFIHDISDILIDAMKMVNYLKLEGGAGFFLSELFFVSNLIVWIYYRLYVYPMHALKSAIFYSAYAEPSWEALQNLISFCLGFTAREDLPSSVNPQEKYYAYFLMCVLLSILFCMHVFWTYLLLRILYKVLFYSIHEAGAEEYEGGSASESDREGGGSNKKAD